MRVTPVLPGSSQGLAVALPAGDEAADDDTTSRSGMTLGQGPKREVEAMDVDRSFVGDFVALDGDVDLDLP